MLSKGFVHCARCTFEMKDPFGYFLTDFNEIFRISFFRPGSLNCAVRYDPTSLQFLKFHVLMEICKKQPNIPSPKVWMTFFWGDVN